MPVLVREQRGGVVSEVHLERHLRWLQSVQRYGTTVQTVVREARNALVQQMLVVR